MIFRGQIRALRNYFFPPKLFPKNRQLPRAKDDRNAQHAVAWKARRADANADANAARLARLAEQLAHRGAPARGKLARDRRRKEKNRRLPGQLPVCTPPYLKLAPKALKAPKRTPKPKEGRAFGADARIWHRRVAGHSFPCHSPLSRCYHGGPACDGDEAPGSC